MPRFNLDDYVEVKDRIPLFLEDYPEGRIVTEIHYLDFNATPAICVVKTELYRDHHASEPMATGFAYEREGVGGMANKTSFLENAETSSVGRALANANYTGNGQRPSREEMEKVQRVEAEQASLSASEKKAKAAEARKQKKEAQKRLEDSLAKLASLVTACEGEGNLDAKGIEAAKGIIKSGGPKKRVDDAISFLERELRG